VWVNLLCGSLQQCWVYPNLFQRVPLVLLAHRDNPIHGFLCRAGTADLRSGVYDFQKLADRTVRFDRVAQVLGRIHLVVIAPAVAVAR